MCGMALSITYYYKIFAYKFIKDQMPAQSCKQICLRMHTYIHNKPGLNIEPAGAHDSWPWVMGRIFANR